MSDRIFDMRLSCVYTGDENEITGLEVELFADGVWEAFGLDMQSPGFLVFVYAIFTCQHRMFHVTAARQSLLLDSARGTINVATDGDWKIKTLQIDFEGKLITGQAGQEDIDVITRAMNDCPVSVNLREVSEYSSSIRFV